jgi:hypothetical protein
VVTRNDEGKSREMTFSSRAAFSAWMSCLAAGILAAETAAVGEAEAVAAGAAGVVAVGGNRAAAVGGASRVWAAEIAGVAGRDEGRAALSAGPQAESIKSRVMVSVKIEKVFIVILF